MLFASPRVEEEWKSGCVFPTTASIVLDGQAYALDRWKWTFVLTCVWRSQPEDRLMEGSGIHCLWRAVDIRDRDISPEAVADLATYLNRHYIYDPQRTALTVCYSKPHGTGPHVHVQSHPRTILRPAFVPGGGTFGGAGATVNY
jgi:hypothetical protein